MCNDLPDLSHVRHAISWVVLDSRFVCVVMHAEAMTCTHVPKHKTQIPRQDTSINILSVWSYGIPKLLSLVWAWQVRVEKLRIAGSLEGVTVSFCNSKYLML